MTSISEKERVDKNLNSPFKRNQPRENSEISSAEKIEKLQKELHKSKIEINRLENTITKLQGRLSSLSSGNNTSDSFLLTSEFKKEWISLGSESIMECFENVFNRSVLLCHMVQETVLLTYQEANIIIEKKVSEIKKFFNINDTACPNEKFYSKIKPLFVEFFSSIFLSEDFAEYVVDVISKLGKSINKRQIAKYFSKEISQDLESDNLKVFIKKTLRLCFYMHLHSPKLSVNIEPFEKRELEYYYYNRFNFINLEGFDHENTPCLMILPPPIFKKNYPFQGLKPFVYIIGDPDERIMENCEKHKMTNGNLLKHSKSYGGGISITESANESCKNESFSNRICEENSLFNNQRTLVTSSSSKLKKSNIFIMESNNENDVKKDDILEADTKLENNLYSKTFKDDEKLNEIHITSINPHFKKTSRNVPTANLNPIKTHYIENHFEKYATFQQQQHNISIEKEINFDFICTTTLDAKKLGKATGNSTTHTGPKGQGHPASNSPKGIQLNSEKTKNKKTKNVIKQQKPKCINIKMNKNDFTMTHDSSRSGHQLSSKNTANSNITKRNHKKIVENLLSTNTTNCNDKINIVYKRVKKSMPICFTNDLLKYRNNFTRSNNVSISVANGSGEVTTFKKGNNSNVGGACTTSNVTDSLVVSKKGLKKK